MNSSDATRVPMHSAMTCLGLLLTSALFGACGSTSSQQAAELAVEPARGVDGSVANAEEIAVSGPLPSALTVQSSLQVARAADGRFVVVWLSSVADEIQARLFQADGTAQGPALTVAGSGGAYEARVGMDASGSFVISWRTITANASGDEVLFQRFDAQGGALGEPQSALVYDGLIDLHTGQPGDLVQAVLQEGPAHLAMSVNDNGDFVIGWIRYLQVGLCCAGLTGVSFSPYGIFYARPYFADGTPRRGPVQISAGQSRSFPALAMDAHGNFVAAWRDINLALSSSAVKLRHYDANGNALSNAVTIANSEGAIPSLAMNGSGTYNLLWTRGSNSNREIISQRFHPDGSVSGPPQMVIQHADSVRRSIEPPAIAMAPDGRYAVVWAEVQFTDDNDYRYDLYARCYDASGHASSAMPVKINQQLLSDRAPQQLPPAPALPTLDYDGKAELVVSWHRQIQNTSEIRARRIAGCS